ncbi:hypothetical protein B7P43_G02342 [Cryptotermes secundus]|nr:hypothetical protein B7P43_G02342 [Cryptotermes secundus]
MIRQSVGAGTFQKNSHANPGKKILPLQNSFHIITDSEEENNEKETNKNAKACRTGSLKGLSPVKSTQDINTMKSVNARVVTSTPLQRQRSSGDGVSSLPSPILPDVPPLTVKIKRTGTSQTSLAESEKMTASAQKGSGYPAVISDEKIKSDARKRTRISRNLYKDGDGDTALFSAEKQSELRFGPSQNSPGRSSKRFNSVTAENRGACNSRKSSRLRAKTRKKKRTGQVNKENKMTSRKQYLKNQVEISVEGNASDEKKSSRNQGMKRNVEDVADGKSRIESSNIGEITQRNKVAKKTWQEKKTSKLVPRLNSSEQKKFRISAVPEQKTKRQSVSESEIDLRRSKRKRVKRLEYWRGERIQYKVGADFCREVAGIDSGFPSRQWVGAAKPSVQYQKEGFQFPQKDIKGTCSRKMVLVPYGNANCELECFSTLRVESDNTGYQEQNFTVLTGLEVPGMSAGFVEVAPFCESYSIVDSNLVFHISVGTPIVTIHETTRNMKKGEFFFVPQGVHYSVRNDAGRKVVLIFTKYDN